MGGSVKRMFDRARSKMAKSQVCATCEPTQLAAGTRGGCQSFGMQVMLARALAPDFVCLQIDLRNALNAIVAMSVLRRAGQALRTLTSVAIWSATCSRRRASTSTWPLA